MKSCPSCGVAKTVGTLSVEQVLVANPVGSFSLAGVQTKVTARDAVKLSCTCGWSVLGRIEGKYFVAEGGK